MSLVQDAIFYLFGEEAPADISIMRIGGGCINNAGWFEWRERKYFLKWNSGAEELFAKESLGLQLIESTTTLTVPKVIGQGKSEDVDYLCLSFISRGNEISSYWEDLGRQLAQLHRNSADSFGLHFDNHIGRLPQSNTKNSSWVDFFISERIEPQLRVAASYFDKQVLKDFERLIHKLSQLLPEERPALIHGDLWSGNVMSGQGEKPYVFDPAVYYGNREAELAFTTMFGGFDELFYQSYSNEWSLEPGFEGRIGLYNLYPLLVHVNLFGAAYTDGVVATIRKYL